MVTAETCLALNKGYSYFTFWGVLVAVFIGLSFYFINWNNRKKWYIIVSSILIFISLIILFYFTGWFADCI